jgi:DNA polymerase phi
MRGAGSESRKFHCGDADADAVQETDVDGDEEGVGSSSTGSWKAQLHFVWSLIFDTYFISSVPQTGRAPFQDFFRVVVDGTSPMLSAAWRYLTTLESLFANTSSPQRRFWGFSVFSRALPLVDNAQMPLLFTPNFMRCWMNNLSSPDRYLHKAALGIAKSVQEIVKENPKVGFTLLSRLVGTRSPRPRQSRVS